MKKLVLLMFIGIVTAGAALYADDALTMPLRTGRLYIVPSYIYADKNYTSNGTVSTQGGMGAIQMFNLSMALEYGITEWLTGAVQWSPGWNAWSKVDVTSGYLDPSLAGKVSYDANIQDVGDLFVGAKFQLIGKSSPIDPLRLDSLRFALATGLKIPLTQIDFTETAQKMYDEIFGAPKEKITIAALDHHSLGVGVRSYLDYIFTENFFINFYNETIFYPMNGKLKNYAGYTNIALETGLKAGNAWAMTMMNADGTPNETAIGQWMSTTVDGQQYTAAALAALGITDTTDSRVATLAVTMKTRDVGKAAMQTIDTSQSVNYKFDTTFEIEPHYELTLNNDKGKPVGLAFGFPVNWKYSPDITLEGNTLYNTSSQALAIKPNVSIFFYGWKLPTQFQFTYDSTVWGVNTPARQTFSFYVKFYFQIPGGNVKAVQPGEDDVSL